MNVFVYIFIYFLFVFLPIVLWLIFFRNKDKSEPEPLAVMIKLILIGGVLAIAISITFEFIVDGFFLRDYADLDTTSSNLIELNVPVNLIIISVLGSVAIEEFAKYIFLTHKVYFLKSFNQIRDGIIYGISIGLGFAFFENTAYFFDSIVANELLTDTLALVVMRSIGPLSMHIVTSGIIGLCIGKKKFSKSHSKKYIVKGMLIAILIHFTYNVILVFFQAPLLSIISVVAGFIYLMKEMVKIDNRVVWKLVWNKKL